MIGMMVFIIVLAIIFYFVLFSTGQMTIEQLQEESDMIPLKIISAEPGVGDDIAFIIDGKVDTDKLKEVANMDYTQLKSKLGIRSDFCIYFEDKDGNIIDISGDIEKENVVGIGDPDFSIGDYDCG